MTAELTFQKSIPVRLRRAARSSWPLLAAYVYVYNLHICIYICTFFTYLYRCKCACIYIIYCNSHSLPRMYVCILYTCVYICVYVFTYLYPYKCVCMYMIYCNGHCSLRDNNWSLRGNNYNTNNAVQGGENVQDALSLHVIFRKRAL